MLIRRIPPLRSLPALLVLFVACSSTTPAPTPSNESDGGRSGQGGQGGQASVPGLEHKVTLVPAEVRSGQNVEIQSVVTNRSNSAITLQSRICGLDLEGDLTLRSAIGFMTCSGHSMAGSLAPGESVQSSEMRRVASTPGTYTLRVRHALNPELWTEVRVVVR